MKKMYVILICITTLLLMMGSILACQMPKKVDKFISLKGNIYDQKYKPYSQVMFNKNQIYIFGVRLEQNRDYEIVAIYGKNVTCIKKVKSYPSLMAYCDNSFCGGFQYCGSLNKKTAYLKNASYYIYNAEDVDCKNKKILKNKPILY